MPYVKCQFMKNGFSSYAFLKGAFAFFILFHTATESLQANEHELLQNNTSTSRKAIVYMGNQPPYSFLNDQGEVSGTAIDKVRRIFAEAGVEMSMTLRPWSRAISMFEGDEMSFLMMLDRVPEREDRYVWISPLASQQFKLISRKRSDFIYKTHDDFINGDHKAVCFQNSSICEQLLNYGFKKENLVEVPNSLNNGLLRILQFGRADFTIMEENVLKWQQENFKGVWPFRVADDIDYKMTSYLAGHKNMPEDLKNKLMMAVKKLKFDQIDKTQK